MGWREADPSMPSSTVSPLGGVSSSEAVATTSSVPLTTWVLPGWLMATVGCRSGGGGGTYPGGGVKVSSVGMGWPAARFPTLFTGWPAANRRRSS
jgi:hypothetical protein